LELVVNNLNSKTSLIQLRGWEAIETLRGQKFDFMIIDEVASMRNFWEKWHEVLRPTLSDTRGSVLFISTPKGFNHFYDLYNIEIKDKDYKSFHYTSYDNPYIPKDEIDKAKIEMTENRFYQEYMADFRKQEGLVYKEFERERHLFDDLPDYTWVDKISGVDFGFVNPTGIVLIHKDKKGCYWIDNEVYRTGLTNDQIVNAINALRPEKVYPDPEAPDKIDELRRAGIPVWEVTKGKDSIVNGITKIKELFKADRIKINRKCVNLISELESYAYDPDTNKETPIAEKNHLLDAMRYAITMNEQSPIIEKIQDQFWIEQMRHRNLAGFE
jgi:PBSX family phage terminase large subunit